MDLCKQRSQNKKDYLTQRLLCCRLSAVDSRRDDVSAVRSSTVVQSHSVVVVVDENWSHHSSRHERTRIVESSCRRSELRLEPPH